MASPDKSSKHLNQLKLKTRKSYLLTSFRVMDNAILWFNFQINLRILERIAGQNVTIDKELVNGVAQWAFVARRAGMTILMVVMEPLVAKLGMNVP